MQIIRSPEDVNKAIDAMVGFVESLTAEGGNWILVGISDGGIPLSQELAKRVKAKLGIELPLGNVNVTFHRDDIGSRPITRPKAPTFLPEDIDRSNVILVDDVVHSGRTIRAALDELFEHGRPNLTKLVSLVDRGHRVLPIQPDYTSFVLELERSQSLKVVIDAEDEQGNRIWAMENEN